MNLDWILNPLTCYVVVALALAASIAVFISARGDVHRLRQAAETSRESFDRKIQEMAAAVAALEQRPPEPVIEAPVARPASVRPALNLTRRTQALRMRRRGESVESIAAALSAPRNEIELLLKIYEVVEYRRQLKPGAASSIPN